MNLSLTLCQSNGSKVVCFHNTPLHREIGVQYVTTVTDSGIINEDIHSSMTFKDLFYSSVHCVCVGQVKDHSAGRVSLKVKEEKK